MLEMHVPSCLHLPYTFAMVSLDNPADSDFANRLFSFVNTYLFLSSHEVLCGDVVIFLFVKILIVDK